MSEFTNKSIPENERQSMWKILIVSLGLTSVAINMIVGGILGASMSPEGWISVIIIGGIILAIIAAYTSYYSYKSGYGFALQVVDIFGVKGSRLIAGFVGLVILGWYSIQASLLGNVIYLNSGISFIPEELFLFLIPIVLSFTAVIGFQGLTRLSLVAVPAIFLFTIIALFRPESEQVEVQSFTTSWTVGLTSVITLWVMGAVATIGDVTRYARSEKSAISSAIVAFIVGNTGLMLAGAWAANKFGVSNLSEVLTNTGLPIIGLLLLIANIWSTNDNSIYSIGLNWSHATGKRYRNIVLLAAFFAAVISLFKPYESEILANWLNTLGVVVPPLGGVIIGRRLGKITANPNTTWFSLAAGISISLVNLLELGPLFGLLTAVFVQYLFEKNKTGGD